jgi:hypothetical protein
MATGTGIRTDILEGRRSTFYRVMPSRSNPHAGAEEKSSFNQGGFLIE